MAPYAFTRLTADGLPLVREWLGRPHVAEWWPDGGDEIAQVIAECDGEESGTVPYLVHLHGRPFAYLQCTRKPSGVRGIDQFIGEADLLNRGHGSGFIRQFLRRAVRPVGSGRHDRSRSSQCARRARL